MTAPATAPRNPRKPRRKLPPAPAPIPFPRRVRVIEGTHVNAVEDSRCIGRWHLATKAQPGEVYYTLPPAFLGSLREAQAKVVAMDALLHSVYAWDAEHRTTTQEDLPCAA